MLSFLVYPHCVLVFLRLQNSLPKIIAKCNRLFASSHSHVVPNRYAGELEKYWNNTNKRLSSFKV